MKMTSNNWPFPQKNYMNFFGDCSNDLKPEMITGVQIVTGIPHDEYDIRGIAHARQTEKTTFLCKDDCTYIDEANMALDIFRFAVFFKVVLKIIQASFNGVLRNRRGFFKGIPWKFPGCFQSGSKLFQKDIQSVSNKFFCCIKLIAATRAEGELVCC